MKQGEADGTAMEVLPPISNKAKRIGLRRVSHLFRKVKFRYVNRNLMVPADRPPTLKG